MAVSKQPAISPETSSGEGLEEEPTSRGEAKWKRFHPFRVVRKIFRRRIKREGTSVGSDTSKKSWSTSELQSVQVETEGKSEVTSSLKIGLSVSHDSIFSPESGVNPINNDEINVARGSSLSVRHASIKNMFKDELFTKIRSRRDSDDDIGLPHSPCTSPTTADVLAQGLKDKTSKCQAACSVGSLISMGSSENEEDSAGHSSGHSSRMSLLEKRSLDSEGELDLNQPIPLNHNAAHHKIAVRPKRTYGLPRRRKSQVATSKMNALPSTPEVTEDNGKTFQSLEKFETLKLSSETTYSSYIESRTTFCDTSELHASGLAASTSLGTLSNILFETEMSQIKQFSLSENSKLLEIQDAAQHKEIDLKKQYLSVLEKKQDRNNFNVITEQEFSLNHSECKKKINDFFEDTNISNSLKELAYSSLEQKSEDSRNEERLEFAKNNQDDKNKIILNEFSDSLMKIPESSLSVSSLVKNIDNCNPNSIPRKSDDVIENVTTYNISGEQSDLKTNHFINEENINSLPIISQNSIQMNNDMDIKLEDKHLSDDLKLIKLSQECLSQITPKSHGMTEKLNIDSEFILKPLKKDFKLSPESNALNKEKLNEKEDENSLVSLLLKNENKLEGEITSSDIKENRIFISHHSSLNQDLKDILVTEAHNYAALEENIDIALIPAQEKIQNFKKENSNDPWVSSVDISTSKAVHDVRINSSTSTICNNQCFEDKVTISINSLSENTNAKSSDLNKINEALKHSCLELNNKLPLLKSDSDSNEKLMSKQIQKSHLPDANLFHLKANTQKRLSVEIVPFSQRMKERKYQPISFNNKDTVVDNDKKHFNSLVERKLSDRKLINKNKDLDKTNNRHSFSGTLVSEKKEEGKTIIEKKIVKSEKMQYPIQFRIHKNIPKSEVKEKSFNDTTLKENKTISNKDVANNKINPPSLKTNNDLKFPFKGDGIQTNDNSSKWEIKIQTALQNNEFKNTSCDQETSEILSVQNHNDSQAKDSYSNLDRSISALDDLEKSVKNFENSSKPLKDAPVISDEPEPELFRVFARRSIKQKHSDKIKDDKNNLALDENSLYVEKSENEIDSTSTAQIGTIIKITDASKSHNDKTDLIKIKSKSFCEKEKSNSISLSPLKEINSLYKESQAKIVTSDNIAENVNLHQRFVNITDHLIDSDEKAIKYIQNDSNLENSFNEAHIYRESSLSNSPTLASVNGNLSNGGNIKETQEMFNSKESHTPSWLQLAQQRRELREQRERLLLGGSTNSYLDASNKPSRSSKVWDMVNNFQKLQMT